MKMPFFLFMTFAAFGVEQAAAQSVADNVLGRYWSPKKDGIIEIYKQNGKYYGKIIWGNDPKKDVNNPDPNLRNRDVVGMTFITDLIFEDGLYTNGEIYDPQSGKKYDCEMWLVNGNLKIRGYLGIRLLGQTETFEKVR